MAWMAHLPERGIVSVTGQDRVAFLQGLVSNDIEAARPGHAVWSALLSPQGKWLADFFVFADADSLKLDCERAQIPMLIQRLSRFRLRMAVALTEDEATRVYVAWGEPPVLDADIAPDPRLPDFAWRVLSAANLSTHATAADWDRYCHVNFYHMIRSRWESSYGGHATYWAHLSNRQTLKGHCHVNLVGTASAP